MSKSNQKHKLDERNHVELPLLEQLRGLDWEVIDLTDEKQGPDRTFRESFTEAVLLPVLRERLKVNNDWMEGDQVKDAVKSGNLAIDRRPRHPEKSSEHLRPDARRRRNAFRADLGDPPAAAIGDNRAPATDDLHSETLVLFLPAMAGGDRLRAVLT